MQLAMKLVVAQLCRAKDHESIEGAECVRTENVMQFRTTMYHQLATSLPPHSESLGRFITGQQVHVHVDGLDIGWYSELNLPLIRQSRRVLPFLLSFPCTAEGGIIEDMIV